MRVLIACEFSGVVRRAFRERGHDAWSCDLLPAEDGSLYHIQADVRHVAIADYNIGFPWDLMIAHPPCTYLCNSGVRWLSSGITLNPERHKLMKEACDFFAQLYAAPIPKVCIENPVMHKYARNYLQETWRCLRHDARPTQTIQPWQFGHGEIKRSCLWLRGLPELKPTQIVEGRKPRVHYASPGLERWKERSRTLEGIGKAMAEQWGSGS